MAKRPSSGKALAYVRASTGRQEITPKDQRERIEAYCKMAGLDLVEIVTERGVSAKIRLARRPDGSKVLALLESGISHVVALKLDRLFRSAADALARVEEWHEAGVSLHLVDMGGMPLNTASSMGKMILTMLAGFAEFERNVIRERTMSALRYKRAHGLAYNHAPYGFVAVNGALMPNGAELRVLENIRALRERGTSYGRIADELNGSGVPSKTGGGWHPYSVQKVLRTAGA